MSDIDKLNKMINQSNNIVFFGGAGVSTESGIPDFRSVDGLYRKKYKYNPEEILSHHFFINNTKEFYEFYFDKMIYKDVLPNDCHKKLVELEKVGKLKAIITQNIDNLHSKAGSQNIYQLHGTINDNYCMLCNNYYDLNYMIYHRKNLICSCGGIIKPDVVLYEEPLNDNIVNDAIKAIKNADMLIIGGTSLNVFPAASLIDFFNGKYLVVINKDKTSCDNLADLVINDNIGSIFKQIKIA
ncbi:MAG: NAD-dependent protein deacylase [Bacilli bacterium]|nr:NAD-dependent protein deacylase [Bacilli bacterium]